MKGIIISTNNEIKEMDFAELLYKTVGAVVGGHIEHVNPQRLDDPYCMIVNEEGRLLGLSVNPIGSYFYKTDEHCQPIVGDIVIMKNGFTDGEPDIVGLDDADIEELAIILDDVQQELGM